MGVIQLICLLYSVIASVCSKLGQKQGTKLIYKML